MSTGKGTVNKVILIGRLGADPELSYTKSGTAVVKLNLATNRVWKNESGEQIEKTDWNRVIAWRKQAEILAQYLKKGSQVYIEGRLETRSWEDDSGKKNFMTEVIVEEFTLLGGGEKKQNNGYSQNEPVNNDNITTDFEDSSDVPDGSLGDDLPF